MYCQDNIWVSPLEGTDAVGIPAQIFLQGFNTDRSRHVSHLCIRCLQSNSPARQHPLGTYSKATVK